MKSPDELARQNVRILLDAAEESAASGHGYMVPVAVLRSLRIVPAAVSSYTLAEAARWLDIPERILDAAAQHRLIVNEIVHPGRAGAGKR